MSRVLVAFVVAASTSLVAASQITFEQTTADLKSPNADVRLRAVELLKDAAYPEAAVPLAAVITDLDTDVQLEAIAAELNIFLAEKVVSRKRVGLVIEVRNKVEAAGAFSAGPFALGPRPVPMEALTALRAAAHSENPRVALEAIYAFGTLAVDPVGTSRRELLHAAGPDLAAIVGSPDENLCLATVRVIGRVFARRSQDEVVEPVVGDAIVTALNDKDNDVRASALDALGAMRYDRALQAVTDLFQFYGHGAGAEAALDAVAHIAHRSSAELFLKQLASKDPMLKVSAIEGLARLGDPARATGIQTSLSGERNDRVLLAGRFSAVLLSQGSVDSIVEDLTRAKLHDQALQYLIELAPGRTSLYARSAQDPDARLRFDIADILGLSGEAAALPIVEPLMHDSDSQVARAAERAVARLRAAIRRSS